MTPKKLYLCPQKLQAKLLIGWWTVGDLCITLVLLLAFFLTGYAPFFLALCLGYLFLSLRFDGKSNLLGGLKRHMLYHTTHQLFVKTVKEQNKPHKKALPIQRVIDFKLEDNYVISDGHYVYFYRYYAPNTHIMTDDEIQSEIGKLGRLFDTLKCSFTLFATDKVENLEAIKNYYLSLPVRYEYINSEIVESIERSDVESSAVQRAYYIIYRTDSPQEDTEDGGPFIYDLLKRTETLTNSNYFTGGVAGMGKSFLNKKIIKFLRMFGVKIYIFDPEGEYGDLVHQMGGTVINRASGKWKNNIFQVRRFKSADEDDRIGLEYGGETPVYYQHLSWLQEQLSIIHSGLSADNLRALMVMVQDMYKEFDIDADTDFSKLTPLDYPTYTDLYTFIEKHSQKEYKMLTPETMKQLLLHLKSCYDGALSPLFNGHTNIINSDFICFNMKDLLSGSEERSNAVLNNDFAWAWQVMMQKDGYTCICLDEMHLFLRNPYMRKLLQSSVYRARKYNGMIGCCTQRVLQCLNSEYDEEVSAILDMSPTKFLFHPGPVDHDVIKDKLKLTDGESNYISNSHKGHCLVMAGHERYAVHIGKMPHEDALFGSGGGR